MAYSDLFGYGNLYLVAAITCVILVILIYVSDKYKKHTKQ